MELAMIGLGKMGGNMAARLLRGGHHVVVYNRSPAPVRAAEAEGAEAATSLEDVVARLSGPRTVWLMLPAGQVTEDAVIHLVGLLSPGDILVDGGNSNYKDSQRRAAFLADKGIYFVDSGTSGGIWGLAEGYSERRWPRRPTAAGDMSARPVRDTSSRWFTTASSMA